jgi:undecaprenyl-diphosphatase
MVAFTRLAGPPTVALSGGVMVVALLILRRSRAALFVILAIAGAGALNLALKAVFQQARPTLWPPLTLETGYGFTSGHATASFALGAVAVVLAWGTRWRWVATLVAVSFAALIAFSRLYLGARFPSDVLAAWCITLAWLTILALMLRPTAGPKVVASQG